MHRTPRSRSGFILSINGAASVILLVMPNVPRHLIVDIPGDESESLLNEWRWLIGDDKRALLVTASGDVFLVDADEHVLWLETGSGRMAQVASSVLAFEAALEEDSNQREWLLAPVIEELRASGKLLKSHRGHISTCDNCASARRPKLPTPRLYLSHVEM